MNRYEALMQRIADGERILIDGATGTEIEVRGVPQVDRGWNSGGALTHPDVVRQVHEDYIRHGAEIVISNTFATGRNVTRDAGMEDQFEFLNRHAVELAVQARENMKTPNVLVAGGISAWSFTGNHPSLEALHGDTTEQARIMAGAGGRSADAGDDGQNRSHDGDPRSCTIERFTGVGGVVVRTRCTRHHAFASW